MSEPLIPAIQPPPADRRGWYVLAVLAGLVLVAVGIAYAGAFRRSCGDTWIGLAAGRLICERGYTHFPVGDEFTWTFAGRTWCNQNWLYHVLMFWLYRHVFPTALVGLKLAGLLVMAVTIILCARKMCGEVMLAAILAIGALAAGMPLWEIRPAMGSHVLACLMLLTLIMATYARSFWGLLVLPVLIVWGNTHGGFLFGYVMVAAWLLGEIAERYWHPVWRTMSVTGIVTTAIAAIISVPLNALVSPFGWTNFTHPFVVMRSPVFQGIWEWHSPFDPGLPANLIGEARAIQIPFFIALGVCAAGLGVGLLLHDFAWRRLSLARRTTTDAELSGANRGITLSEIAMVLLVAYLGFGHIRFIVTFYTLTAPFLCKFLVIRFREAALAWNASRGARLGVGRSHARAATSGLALLFSFLLVLVGRERIADAYVDPEGRPWREGIFLHHIADDTEPRAFTAFARANGLTGRLLTDWVWGGYVMFDWPQAKLFVDGRSQALFDEKMYELYHSIVRMSPPRGLPPAARGEQIDAALEHPDVPSGLNTEMVLWSSTGDAGPERIAPLLATGKWAPVLWNGDAILMVRRDATSPGLPEAMARFERLDLKWPDGPWGLASRAMAAQFLREPNYEAAIRYYKAAIEKAPYAAFYTAMLSCFVGQKRVDEAARYYNEQAERLAVGAGCLSPAERQESLDTLASLVARIRQASP
jgi:pentatricopeptide repeat protein